MAAEAVPPPERATLFPVPIVAPCPPDAAPAVPQKQQLQVPVVTGAVHADDEVVAVTALENAQVATEMNKFLVELQEPRSYVGVSAFLIFALMYRVRVRV